MRQIVVELLFSLPQLYIYAYYILIRFFFLFYLPMEVPVKGKRMDVANALADQTGQATAGDADPPASPLPVSVRARSLAAGQVDRIVTAALPDGMHIARDARIAMQKAATVSLLYLSCLADDERRRETRRRVTLTANDIKVALKAGGMGHLAAQLGTGQVKRGRTDTETQL
uniref:WGS project CAEQ00000000 data, annotated contig 1328 n=1 Tax=Trypanosoma congolense (strain IL3000) TaxID=1068625 RepID=F9W5I2_TRYCI|nr:unnamed protein product [Trypanosoma congolense IL3000]